VPAAARPVFARPTLKTVPTASLTRWRGFHQRRALLSLPLAHSQRRTRGGTVSDRPIVIVDDVVTSGARMKAAIWRLRQIGKTVAGVAALARTVQAPVNAPSEACIEDFDASRSPSLFQSF